MALTWEAKVIAAAVDESHLGDQGDLVKIISSNKRSQESFCITNDSNNFILQQN